uniref:Secreted protein n=1 Tax=Favella ehrenbergii TaxID=182087 RepID=A0A7S3MMU7_9SPIT
MSVSASADNLWLNLTLLLSILTSTKHSFHSSVPDVGLRTMVHVLYLVDLFKELLDVGLVHCRASATLPLVCDLAELHGDFGPDSLLHPRHGGHAIVQGHPLALDLELPLALHVQLGRIFRRTDRRRPLDQVVTSAHE